MVYAPPVRAAARKPPSGSSPACGTGGGLHGLRRGRHLLFHAEAWRRDYFVPFVSRCSLRESMPAGPIWPTLGVLESPGEAPAHAETISEQPGGPRRPGLQARLIPVFEGGSTGSTPITDTTGAGAGLNRLAPAGLSPLASLLLWLWGHGRHRALALAARDGARPRPWRLRWIPHLLCVRLHRACNMFPGCWAAWRTGLALAVGPPRCCHIGR